MNVQPQPVVVADPFADESEVIEVMEQEAAKASPQIEWAQRALNQVAGARLTVDGQLGPQTREAIKSFQRRRGLTIDGILGPRTEQGLVAAGAHPRAGGVAAPAPPQPQRPGAAAGPPTEGPYPGITGAPCQSGRGRCWKGAKSRDIVDADVPWNRPNNRSPQNYDAVLDYFNVGDSPHQVENPRYLAAKGSTYCNIYLHDVTRAMWASIPHWIRDASQKHPPVGWNELSANRTVEWLRANATTIGWLLVDATICEWLHQQAMDRTNLPLGDGTTPAGVLRAGATIAAAKHPDLRLLQQPSYAAQQFANLGLPVAIVWRNPKGHGHAAMVRPEREGLRGEIHRSGKFLPRSAQAGARNFTNRPASWIARLDVRIYVHA